MLTSLLFSLSSSFSPSRAALSAWLTVLVKHFPGYYFTRFQVETFRQPGFSDSFHSSMKASPSTLSSYFTCFLHNCVSALNRRLYLFRWCRILNFEVTLSVSFFSYVIARLFFTIASFLFHQVLSGIGALYSRLMSALREEISFRIHSFCLISERMFWCCYTSAFSV